MKKTEDKLENRVRPITDCRALNAYVIKTSQPTNNAQKCALKRRVDRTEGVENISRASWASRRVYGLSILKNKTSKTIRERDDTIYFTIIA